MTQVEKYNIANEIIKRIGITEKDIVESIAFCILYDRFYYELKDGQITKFLTWEDSLIDGKRYIYFNNLWINPGFRRTFNISALRKRFRDLFPGVQFYWFDRKRQVLVYRR